MFSEGFFFPLPKTSGDTEKTITDKPANLKCPTHRFEPSGGTLGQKSGTLSRFGFAFLLAARQSPQAASALAPQRRFKLFFSGLPNLN